MAENTLTIKFDKETTLPLLDGLGKSAYAIAVAHGFKGSEQEWLDSLRGMQGATGPVGPQGIQGPAGPRGPKGDPGSAEIAAQLLRQKNIYLPNSNVGTVIAKVIELFSDNIKYTPKRLEYEQPNAGQTFIDLRGEPHFKVSINGGEKKEFESDNMRVNIEPFGADNILIKYFDLADREYQNIVIKGIAGATPEETYEDGSGAVWKKYGKKIVLDASNYTGETLKWQGKWGFGEFDIIEMLSNSEKTLTQTEDYNESYKWYGKTLVIPEPQNIILNCSIELGDIDVDSIVKRQSLYFRDSGFKWNGSEYVRYRG
jgi:hypothetical protein